MKVFLISHSSGLKGPVDFLEDHLFRKKHTIFHLQHPLDVYKGRKTLFSMNHRTIMEEERNGRGIYNLFLDFVQSVFYAKKYSYEVFIGSNNFDTLPGIFLKKILRKNIKKVIYFSSDYSERRYKNYILDTLYSVTEYIVIKNADIVVSNTKRAEKKRIEMGLSKKKSVVIPNGVYLKEARFYNKEIDKESFVYIGNVTKEHGIVDFVKITKGVLKKLVVFGQGDQWQELVEYCTSHAIKAEFHYKKSHEETIAYLQKFRGFGLAPYTTDALWTIYSSPLKVNEYIACGIPVIISHVPEIAEYIKENKLGIMYESLSVHEIQKMLREFDTKNFSAKAKKFYKEYMYDTIYEGLSL